MAQNKTVETKSSVSAYVNKIKDAKRKSDFSEIMNVMANSTKLEPQMWGTAIVGFGSYSYKYDSGREGTAPLVAMAARTNAITLYLGAEFKDRDELLEKFGKYKSGKGCIYVQKIEDIDTAVLGKIIKNAIDHRKENHNC